MSDVLQIEVKAGTRVWDHQVKAWRTTYADLRGAIPAPIDREAVMCPADLEPGDRIDVHAMGSWYPGTVLALAPKSGKLVVEYTSGAGKARQKRLDRQIVVPRGCGYRQRQDANLAQDWATAVWAALAVARDKILGLNPTAPESIGATMAPPRLVTGDQARAIAAHLRDSADGCEADAADGCDECEDGTIHVDDWANGGHITRAVPCPKCGKDEIDDSGDL